MAELAVKVSGMVKRGFLVLGQIPNPLCGLGFIPRNNFANGLPDFLPLTGEVSAHNFGRGAGEIVAGDGEVKMKPFSLPTALLFEKPTDCVKVSLSRESFSQVPNEQMKFLQPHDFITLKIIRECQMPVYHPI